MEEKTEDFQEMLNIMKVEEFKQAREQKTITAVFTHLKRGQNQKAELFYKNTIYAKVLNAFMIARLKSIQYNHRLDIFYQQLQTIYCKMQLQKHFQAMKQFKNIRQQERDQKIIIIMSQRKKSQLRRFSNILRCKLFNKKQKSRIQVQITPIKVAYKTDSLFNKQRIVTDPRNDLKQVMTKQNFYKKQLEQSRNSAKSAYSLNSQLGGRRKFAVIKQLPKFPHLQNIEEKIPQKQELYQGAKQILDQISLLQQKKITSSQISRENELKERRKIEQKQEKQQLSQKPSAKKYHRDNILAAICKIKMLEVAQLTQIINECSNSLKYQSLISQKAFLSQSIATLEKIIKL